MRSGLLASIVCAATIAGFQAPASLAQQQQPADKTAAAQDQGWPRQFETKTHLVRIHQPQVDEWPGFDRIKFRAAIVVEPRSGGAAKYGMIVVSARADVAFEERLVLLTDRKLEQLTFPDVGPAEAAELAKIVEEAMPPQRSQSVSLDRIIAELEVKEEDVRKVQAGLTPPVIYASGSPAVLVGFMGKPRFKAAPNTDLLVGVNTNWDVFLEPATGRYYLLNEDTWLVSDRLTSDVWQPAAKVPPGLSKLPDDANWADVRAAVPGKPAAEPLKVFVSAQPAELLATDGPPELQPIPGTRLMLVVNTENDLFYNLADKRYYLLAAGRWFAAPTFDGPWEAASANLPEDFRNIPDDSEAASVLASVPGTPDAKEAVILASLPNRATVSVADVTLNVTYDGEPDFRPIEKTTVRYAYNTPYSVFLVDGRYFCCHNAVWFEAPAPQGAWKAATSVPAAIYTIPPESPKYNVTYVTIYESTPTTVTTSYTAGYTGAQVAATGVVMFGLGLVVADILDDDDCWHYHYRSCYFSYGCGARWRGPAGGWVCAGRRYGPYGGCGGFAAYNPRTGTFSRGAYAYGPRGAAGIRTAYNPSAGVFAYRAGAVTPYGSWGRTAISNGDDWVRAGHRTGPGGSTVGIQGSGGAAAGRVEGRYGNGVTVAKDRDGDIYAGKDGKIYRKSDSGWEGVNPPERAKPATTQAEPARNDQRYLSEKAASRDRGERNVRRSRSAPAERRPQRSGGPPRR